VEHTEHTIHDTARLAGVTTRTLRHYDHIGLLGPSRVGANGYRYYDDRALVRLQRILLLRELGLSLPEIAAILDHGVEPADALAAHLDLLRREQDRLARRITAVEHTLAALTGRGTLMADTMFDGFDHARYREEVEERWGRDARTSGDRWWRAMSDGQRAEWTRRLERLNADWQAASADPAIAPDSATAQELARRHVQWLRSVPGTPAADAGGDLSGYVRGLARMYVADRRFASNYGGRTGAEFVRDALVAFMDARPGGGRPEALSRR
jgi:DNA-binding transcriptional MerR regulator